MPGLQFGAALAAALIVASAPAAAVTVGSFSGFAPGDTQGWVSGAVAQQPVALATGGPGGAGDAYLEAVSGGSLGRLVLITRDAAWTGDYTAAGVGGIAMDLKNFGSSPLSLRLFLGDPNVAGVFSAAPVLLTVGSGWQHVFFPTVPAAMRDAANPLIAPSAPLVVPELRLYHSITAVGVRNADSIVATLGVDNISAVPEPGAAWLLLGGLAFGAWRLRRA